METHFKFKTGEQRKFLLQAGILSKLSQMEISQHLGVSYNTYKEWLSEKCCMPSSIAKNLVKQFNLSLPEADEQLIKNWRMFKSETGKRGGIACVAKYGNPGTSIGRARGGFNSLLLMRDKGIIPKAKEFPKLKYSKELAEFIGILLGDGGITPNQVIISLNAKKDRKYALYVCDLIYFLFKEKPSVYLRKDNTICICISGINLVRYLLSLGLKIGNKVKQQVCVPFWVKSERLFSIACVRGLMDTDGCAVVVKRKNRAYGPDYTLLSFCNYSKPLLSFVFANMKALDLNPSLKLENGYVWVYNKAGFHKYFDIVGTNNPRNLNWRRQIVANST